MKILTLFSLKFIFTVKWPIPIIHTLMKRDNFLEILVILLGLVSPDYYYYFKYSLHWDTVALKNIVSRIKIYWVLWSPVFVTLVSEFLLLVKWNAYSIETYITKFKRVYHSNFYIFTKTKNLLSTLQNQASSLFHISTHLLNNTFRIAWLFSPGGNLIIPN